MPFQTPITIEKVLDRIQAQEYVLPSIQREFAWDTDQVIRLFDSLMRGYPIGAFLFWNVKGRDEAQSDAARDFVFYGVIRDYHEWKSPHCPRLDIPKQRPVVAILDGQQRLTALNIGLRGTHAQKLPWKHRHKLDAYPVKRLYLNIEGPAAEGNELNMEYDFAFLTAKEAEDRGPTWFLVADILTFADLPEIHDYLLKIELGASKYAFRALSRLHAVVKSDGIISYYEEEAQDLDKVLNIFIRVNSGGTQLSYSDLLLSIAVAQWTERDAREDIHGLVDDLNKKEDFAFSKDLILKAGLVLTDVGDVRFKVTNFNRANMATLEREWERVAYSLQLAARLLSEFGFTDENLFADSPLIPIAYYLHRRVATDSYIDSVADRGDRDTVRRWVIRSLLKAGVWGSGLDTLLGALRRAIKESPGDRFPVEDIEREMVLLGKSLVFQSEEIDDLLETAYGNRRVFPLLGLIYPGVTVRAQFHEDHVFPKSRFTKLRLLAAGVAEADVDEYIDRVNRLPNLQLLEGPVNVAKQAELPLAWATTNYPRDVERAAYLAFHDLDQLPNDVHGFIDFYDRRRNLMRDRLSALLETPEAPSA